MNEIYLESKDFNYIYLLYGYESEIFLYNNDKIMKIFKTDDRNVLNNKLQKLKYLHTLNTNDVLPIDLIYIDGIFKGYTSILKKEFYHIDSLKQNKKIRYYILNEVLKKLKYYHSLGITFGDLNPHNILYNKKTNEVILCDLDNVSINELNFDVVNNYQDDYLYHYKTKENMDEFIFNILTVSYIQKIYYAYTLNYLRINGLHGLLNSKENSIISKQMYQYSKDFNGDLFLDHIKKRILK